MDKRGGMDHVLVWRQGRFSRQINLTTVGRVSLALLLVLAVMVASLGVGKLMLSPWEVLRALWSSQPEGAALIVQQLRLPRVVLAALVGGALAVSGLILQAMIRNPLASPDILGITSGASAAAVFYLSFLSATLGAHYLPLAAMIGAATAALAVYWLAWQAGVSPQRLVLTGVGVSALLMAATTFMLVFSPLTTTLSAYVWLTGSVYGASWRETRELGGWLLLIAPWLVLLARQVRVQQLDDGLAQGIGVRVQWLRVALLLLSVALAGAAIAWGGAMAFVGLIAPHIAKRLVAPGFAGQAAMAFLSGAGLVMVADLCGRTLFLPLDLPAGIFVSALGAPFFLYLLIKQRH
ncbi:MULTISPECIES: FecCD family ABC transporter permease [Dickeya]|uniref:Iron ABC transporter permease n=1 Tax=Dickeya solani TaxID=1089444 RepID=A0AAX4EXT9_9GAMM|nr:MULTISPECIES: iron ABC transporter permease [Dickeya]MCA7014884.1 iron ABC transporter permease [Dickeya dadantii]WOA52221.1 iron ABC transporter permease [Dickeya solani]